MEIDEETRKNVHVRDTETKGKGLFASSSIKKGQPILSEAPLVCCQFSWNRVYRYRACDHCMRSLESAQAMARRLAADPEIILPHEDTCCEVEARREAYVTCPHCETEFCSEACYTEALSKYHKILCTSLRSKGEALQTLDEMWRSFHYPPETATVMLICKMAAMVMQDEADGKVLQGFNEFFDQVSNRSQNINHKLLGANFAVQIESMAGILKQMFVTDSFKKLNTLDGVKSLFALIGLNGQGIGTSSLSSYVHKVDALILPEEERKYVDHFIDQLYDNMEKESGQFLNCEGSGLYQLASCTNHSCEPTAEITFPSNNSTLVMVALKDIEQGDEICICYLDECQRERCRHSRRKILRENYIFDCLCERCSRESGELSETSEEEEESSDEEEIAESAHEE